MSSIDVVGLGKAYRSYARKWGRLAEWLGAPTQHQLHWVLRDVTFSVGPGESIGLIGLNGAGKSTLLKIISGITKPTVGTVNRTGRLAALLELGMGFHPDFTGRQNVYMAGQLQGLSADDVSRHMGEIEDFAEIASYIDEPVRTYSSGMQMRLAFSVATAVRPDILIVDEALAVGDIYFQQRCFERIQSFRQQGTTLLFVSHAISTVLHLCERAILLRKGLVAYDGSPKDATDLYHSDVLLQLDKRPHEIELESAPRVEDIDNPSPELERAGGGRGSLRTPSATLTGVRIFDQLHQETQTVVADSVVTIAIQYGLHRDLDDPHIGVLIRNRLGMVLFETNSYCMNRSIGPQPKGTEICGSFTLPALLMPGDYTITTGFANRGVAGTSFEEALSYERDVLAFTVVRSSGSITWNGVINLQPELSIEVRPANA